MLHGCVLISWCSDTLVFVSSPCCSMLHASWCLSRSPVIWYKIPACNITLVDCYKAIGLIGHDSWAGQRQRATLEFRPGDRVLTTPSVRMKYGADSVEYGLFELDSSDLNNDNSHTDYNSIFVWYGPISYVCRLSTVYCNKTTFDRDNIFIIIATQ